MAAPIVLEPQTEPIDLNRVNEGGGYDSFKMIEGRLIPLEAEI